MTVQAALSALKAHAASRAPELVTNLNPPATEGALAAFEAEFGVTLPASARAAYLVHDGEADDLLTLLGPQRWMPLAEVARTSRQLTAWDVRHFDAHRMIPLFDLSGDYLYVESVASPGDDSPLRVWDHERPTEEVEAESVGAFVAQFAADASAGRCLVIRETLRFGSRRGRETVTLIREDEY